MLLAIPWGWFVVGLGILILAAQLARLQMNIKIEGFWVTWGAVFLIGGLSTVLNLASWPLAPIVLILLGVVQLAKAMYQALTSNIWPCRLEAAHMQAISGVWGGSPAGR